MSQGDAQPTHRASLRTRVLYWVLRFASFVVLAPLYRYRAWGTQHYPKRGPVLIVASHQSYLDPLLVGMCTANRPIFHLARDTLFRNRVFGRAIGALQALPVQRGTGDLKAMRQCIDVLKQGAPLLVFPEGTRTSDGSVQPFKPGTMLLVRRAKPKVIPVAIEGPFEFWPKGKALPKLSGRIGVMFGEPIEAEALTAMGDEAAMAHLRQRVVTMQRQLRQLIDTSV